MFNSGGTRLLKDKDATISNTRLLLASWKNSLFGDPYFGTNIKRFIYQQNNIILRDLIIDDIDKSCWSLKSIIDCLKINDAVVRNNI